MKGQQRRKEQEDDDDEGKGGIDTWMALSNETRIQSLMCSAQGHPNTLNP